MAQPSNFGVGGGKERLSGTRSSPQAGPARNHRLRSFSCRMKLRFINARLNPWALSFGHPWPKIVPERRSSPPLLNLWRGIIENSFMQGAERRPNSVFRRTGDGIRQSLKEEMGNVFRGISKAKDGLREAHMDVLVAVPLKTFPISDATHTGGTR